MTTEPTAELAAKHHAPHLATVPCPVCRNYPTTELVAAAQLDRAFRQAFPR